MDPLDVGSRDGDSRSTVLTAFIGHPHDTPGQIASLEHPSSSQSSQRRMDQSGLLQNSYPLPQTSNQWLGRSSQVSPPRNHHFNVIPPVLPVHDSTGQRPLPHEIGYNASTSKYNLLPLPESQQPDPTGQMAPFGVKPRVTASLWEDEGTLCFCVEAKAVIVSRREDNNFINGTKLLNVAGINRGRRDGLLKNERTRHVVKIGQIHEKGTWIPYDRALNFANQENITELLYPLFVHNIGALLYHPTNSGRTNAIIDTYNARKASKAAANGRSAHNPMNQPLPEATRRPNLERSHTFPTPPTSASSVRGSQSNSYEWDHGTMGESSKPLNIDTGLKSRRSLPSTPASTPPRELASPTSDLPIPEVASQFYRADSLYTSSRSQEVSHSPSAIPGYQESQDLRRDCSVGQHNTTLPSMKDILQDNASMPNNPVFPQTPSYCMKDTPRDSASISNISASLANLPQSSMTVRHSNKRSTEPGLSALTHVTTEFPILGLLSRKDGSNGSFEEFAPAFTTFSPKSSPTMSDTSSSSWTDEMYDTDITRLVYISSSILTRLYTKLVADNRASNPRTRQGNGSTKKQSERGQRPLQGIPNSRKRKPNLSGDESDDGGNMPGPKRQRNGLDHSNNLDDRPLACPFNKYDNRLFGPDSPDESYHACATGSFVNIAHLKQHLKRNHYLPRYYCFRCCRRDFASESTVASHMRAEPMCEKLNPPLYRERIGNDLIEELGLDRKNVPGTDRVEYWHRIYNTFFPGAADLRPVSPYYEGPAYEHLQRFLHFSAQVMGELLPAVQQRLGLEGSLSQNNQLRIQQDIQQEAGQRYLQNISSAMMPRLGDLPSFPNETISGGSTALRSDPASRPLAASSATSTLSEMQESQGRPGSQMTIASMTVSSSPSSTSFTQTPMTDISMQLGSQPYGSQQSHLNTPMLSSYLRENGAGTAREVTQTLESASQFCDWLDLPAEFDWDAEFDAVTKLNDTMPLQTS